LKRAVFTGRFRKILRAFPQEVQQSAGKAITEAQTAFGDPHRHSGLGIRKLSKEHFEIRVHLDIRLLFTEVPEELIFDFAGTHDEVRRFLKSVR
jgi:hypothetical protein